MENRNLNKALDIVSKLITGEEVGRKSNTMLYEEYCNNSEVYDIITETCKALNLNLYEYNDTLFISARHEKPCVRIFQRGIEKTYGIKG